MNAIVCDKCGKTVTDMDKANKLIFKAPDGPAYDSLHLCDDCLRLLEEWLGKRHAL